MIKIVSWNILGPSIINSNMEYNVNYERLIHIFNTLLKTEATIIALSEVDEYIYMDSGLLVSQINNTTPKSYIIDFIKTYITKDDKYYLVYVPKPFAINEYTRHGTLLMVRKPLVIDDIRVLPMLSDINALNKYNGISNACTTMCRFTHNSQSYCISMNHLKALGKNLPDGLISPDEYHYNTEIKHFDAMDKDKNINNILLNLRQKHQAIDATVDYGKSCDITIVLGDFNMEHAKFPPGFKIVPHLDLVYGNTMLKTKYASASAQDPGDGQFDYIAYKSQKQYKTECKAYDVKGPNTESLSDHRMLLATFDPDFF